jgi:hypothetical protein
MSSRSIDPPHRIFYGLSIAFCVKSAMRSIDLVSGELAKHEDARSLSKFPAARTTVFLDEIQNIVVQAAATSRYFWPVRKGHEARADSLKQQYSIAEDSPLRLSKDLRDAIEHFDERLDKYLAPWPVGQFIPEYVGPEGRRDGVPVHFFRAYFVDVGIFEMLANRYSIQPIVDEIVRINEVRSK